MSATIFNSITIILLAVTIMILSNSIHNLNKRLSYLEQRENSNWEITSLIVQHIKETTYGTEEKNDK